MSSEFSIDGLLAERKTRRIGHHGKHDGAYQRLEISKLIAKNFEGFDAVRTHLMHPDSFRSIRHPSKDVAAMISLLSDLGWVKAASSIHAWTLKDDLDMEVRWYLQGGWLEEYVYCAHVEAGVDEAFYGQRVEWTVGEVLGKNEIDVVARRGDVLSFTSCKTQRPEQKQGAATALTRFLTEADYWDTHFADNRGKVLLVVTADFIDEMRRNQHRYPTVLARASILDVEMIGLEDIRWDRLVDRIDAHWAN